MSGTEERGADDVTALPAAGPERSSEALERPETTAAGPDTAPTRTDTTPPRPDMTPPRPESAPARPDAMPARPIQLGPSGAVSSTSGAGLGPASAQPVTLRTGAGGDAASGELFDRIGGSDTFDRLVRTFYEGVRADEVLWPMYPSHDLEGAITRLSLFLQQYWGGPTTYSQERGHPRLRMRHMPFAVTPEAREHWLQHMRHAVDTLELAPLDDATLWAYLDRAAHAMVNSFEE